jgi:uracil-DNA glycosylase family 4
MICTNKFPSVNNNNRRIAIIGDFPGRDDVITGEPFTGMAGRFLAALLSKAGYSRSNCFLGNISQYQPPLNKIEAFAWDGWEIKEGLEQLHKDLAEFKPNIVVLLGNVPLKAAMDPLTIHVLKPKTFKFKNSLYRGTLFMPYAGPFAGLKCISTYHPAYTLRDYATAPLLFFDLKRALEEATTPELILPKRTLLTDLSYWEILDRIKLIRNEKKLVATDIEGRLDTMSCISFAISPYLAFIVPFIKKDGTSYWEHDKEISLMLAIAGLLEDPNVPKILQNSLYDTFVLQFSYHITVRNVIDDTMLKWWELFCELPKSLAMQTSILTREPFYKDEGK